MAAETDETARITALHACAVMDTPREAAFDNIVFTVAQLFRVQAAAFSLLDGQRVWSKAIIGPLPQERLRTQALCTHVVESGQLVIIEDASIDARFANLVSLGPDIPVRFFAGAPVIGPDRQIVGVLSVFDRHPRTVPERQQLYLLQLAGQAGELLRIRVPHLNLSS